MYMYSIYKIMLLTQLYENMFIMSYYSFVWFPNSFVHTFLELKPICVGMYAMIRWMALVANTNCFKFVVGKISWIFEPPILRQQTPFRTKG